MKALKNGLEQSLATETGIPDFSGVTNDALFAIVQTISTLLWGDRALIGAANRAKFGETVARLKDSIDGENGKFIARSIEMMLHALK